MCFKLQHKKVHDVQIIPVQRGLRKDCHHCKNQEQHTLDLKSNVCALFHVFHALRVDLDYPQEHFMHVSKKVSKQKDEDN